jgi:ATP-dependent DNA ligase
MLARAGEPPTGEGWAYEDKWDGFRAIVSTEGALRVRSRRGWDMSDQLPELAELADGLVVDGEVVAFNEKASRTSQTSSPGCCAATARSPSPMPSSRCCGSTGTT